MSVDDSLASFPAAMILELPTAVPNEAVTRKIETSPQHMGGPQTPIEPFPDDPTTAPAKLNVPFKPSYNRIASTISTAFTPNSGISHSPWDMIEAVTRPPEDLPPYTILERPSNIQSSDEDEDSQASSTSFNLSEALEDIRELDGMEGSEMVKPLEELRTILINAAVPVRERVEILKNLQLRDNWLLFLAKHFRRVLTKIKKEGDHVDERVRCLQTIFGQIAENKVPPANVSEPSTLIDQGTNVPSPISQAPGADLRASGQFPVSDEEEAPAQSKARNVCRTVPSPVENRSEPSHKVSQEKQKIKTMTNAKSAKVLSPQNRDTRRPQSTTTSEESDPYSHDVYQVNSVHTIQSRYPLCIKVAASKLGRQPLETSGLRHFSPSCERRARTLEWVQAHRIIPPADAIPSASATIHHAYDLGRPTSKRAVERLTAA